MITALTARFPWLVAPSTLGAPFGLPRLRVTPFGEQGWDALTIEVIAVVALTTVTGAWTRRALTRRPAVGRVRAGLSAWVGFVLGAVTANTLRAVAVGATMGFGLVGYGAIVVVGMLSGTVWGAALGWIPGIAAGVAIGRGASRTPAAPTTPTA
ncbi:hypothetical protein CDO52_02360 [Nocardiopsis gilva YIM 90087]|uniref:Uncharacterized protein n=1 Tax=Nocardiopsis gilva YIM 90087 TaxID=1235441 RepID=A0A223S0Z3_9ACTN|nr:hypothetical protein CDO52_02360 [Nocardiopsis gilva YIM 90087]